MRVSRLAIRSWRNLRDVDLNMDKAAPLVCLVGENGAGKSTVLEVLSAAAHSLGISQGVQNTRGDIFTEPHDIDITVYVPPEEIQFSESSYFTDELRDAASRWTGELHLHSVRGSATQSTVSAGVSTQADLNSSAQADTRLSERLGDAVVAALRERRETQHLYLDADRAYPPAEVPLHEYGQIFSQEWRNPDVTRNSAFQPSRTLYTEWIKYFVGVDENELSKYSMALRRARDSGNPDPKFDDPFEGYAASLRQVLPHLRFAGVAKGGGQPRTPIFDSAGIELAFSHLSGGEREVAFILGQIDRFRLRRGLLLIDEPELHLNPDLLRRWLAYLRDTIVSGQVWIATHSLEAVEVAGPSATFVFERNPETRLVTAPKLLSGRPVLSALSAAVGSPAFALGKLRFIYIEGDRQTRERERFYAVCGDETTNRFLEGGGCRDVLRRLSDIKTLSAESQEQLHIGGVIDRDFRTDSQADELERDYSVHVLGCHEVENLFLHPEAIDALLTRGAGGAGGRTAREHIKDAADRHAGLWVADHAAAHLPDDPNRHISRQARSTLAGRSYAELVGTWETLRNTSASCNTVQLSLQGCSLDACLVLGG